MAAGDELDPRTVRRELSPQHAHRPHLVGARGDQRHQRDRALVAGVIACPHCRCKWTEARLSRREWTCQCGWFVWDVSQGESREIASREIGFEIGWNVATDGVSDDDEDQWCRMPGNDRLTDAAIDAAERQLRRVDDAVFWELARGFGFRSGANFCWAHPKHIDSY